MLLDQPIQRNLLNLLNLRTLYLIQLYTSGSTITPSPKLAIDQGLFTSHLYIVILFPQRSFINTMLKRKR